MEAFWADHVDLFGIITASLMTLTLPLFVAVLVNVLRGNKERLVILVTSLLLLVYAFYYGYVYVFTQVEKAAGVWADALYAISIILFEVIHWLIAYAYFECSSTCPLQHSPAP